MLKGRNDEGTIASILFDFKEALDNSKGVFIDAKLFDFTLENGDVIASTIHGVIKPFKKVANVTSLQLLYASSSSFFNHSLICSRVTSKSASPNIAIMFLSL